MAAAQARNVWVDNLLDVVDDPRPTKDILLNLRAKTARLVNRGVAEPTEEEKDLEFDDDDFVGVNEITADGQNMPGTTRCFSGGGGVARRARPRRRARGAPQRRRRERRSQAARSRRVDVLHGHRRLATVQPPPA